MYALLYLTKRSLLRLSAFLRWTRGADGDGIEQLRRRYSIGPKSGIHFSENSDVITKR
jgi:hypothetical protein